MAQQQAIPKNDSLDCLKLRSTLESVKTQCMTGKKKELLSALKPQTKNKRTDGMTLSPSLDLTIKEKNLNHRFRNEEKVCATVESQRPDSPTTLNDRLSSPQNNIQPLMSSKTLVQESISNGKVFSSYSKDQLREFTAQLWCPVKTDLQDSDLNCYNGCLSTTKSVSWCSMRTLVPKSKSLQKTSLLSSMFLPAKLMVKEGTLIEKQGTKQERKKAKKIKKKPQLTEKTTCKSIVTRRINGIVYGRECGNVLISGEKACPKHKDTPTPEYSSFWNWCCNFKIQKRGTGIEELRSRKGLDCGDFCTEGETKCSVHKKCSSTPKGEKTLRAFKVRVFPTAKQKRQLEKMFGDARKTYNLIVDKGVGITDLGEGLESTLKKEFLSDLDGGSFLRETPKDIRGFAVKEYVAGLKAAEKNYQRKLATEEWKYTHLKRKYKKKKIKVPEMKYRLKKECQCITVPHRQTRITNDNGIIFCPRTISTPFRLQHRAIKKNKLLRRMLVSKVVQHDFKIIKTKYDTYYTCFSYEPKMTDNTNKEVCAIDPGVRTPWSVWSPQGAVHEIGKEASERYRVLNEEIARIKHKQFVQKDHSSRLRQQRLQLHAKLKNITSDLHFKAINELIDKYETVILPWFNSTQMIQGNQLSKTTKRSMMCLSHSTFRNRLISKAIVSGTCVIIPADEFKTTMTCHRCLEENPSVGSSETFVCSNCDLCTGRDINAPICIFVRQVKL